MEIKVSEEQPSLEEWGWVNNFNHCVDTEKREWAEKWLSDNIISAYWFKVGADECGIFENRHNIFIVCSGSDKDRKEWQGNFTPYPPQDKAEVDPAYTIEGYHYNYSLVARGLLGTMRQDIKGTKKQIILVGMSRGCLVEIVNQFMCVEEEYKHLNFMAITYDGIKLAKEETIWAFNQKKVHAHIHHRCKTFWSLTALLPPYFLGWRHSDTTLLKLPNVWGFNHIHIGKAIKKAIRIRNKKRR